MRTWVSIGVAGAVGVLARHAVQQIVPRHGEVPWGTLLVNVSGAFILGFLFTLIIRRFETPMWIQEALLVGFLGGYTTFSAFSLETFLMIEHGRVALAASYSIGSVLGGVAAVFAGIHLARAV
jgi:fluoride exporter